MEREFLYNSWVSYKTFGIKGIRLPVLFIAIPFGFGIPGFLGFQSFDMQKVLGLILLVVSIRSLSDANNYLFWTFTSFVTLDLISTLYAPNLVLSLKSFLLSFIYGYGWFFLGYKMRHIDLVSFQRISYYVLLYLAALAILESTTGKNIFDGIRFAYTDGTRFNATLGFWRSGFKAAMGPFATNLVNGYVIVTLYFVSQKFHKYYTLPIALIALLCVQSRAALGIFIVLFLIKNFRNLSLMLYITVASLLFISSEYFGFIVDVFQALEASQENNIGSRILNNTTDLSLFKGSPLLGRGSGYLYLAKTSLGGGILDSRDSSYLTTILIDRGLLSVLIFLFVFFKAISRKSGSLAFLIDYKFALFSIFLCLMSSQRMEASFMLFFLLGLLSQYSYVDSK